VASADFPRAASTDIYLHGTYFVVAHFHFVMGVAAMFGIFAAPTSGSRRCSVA